ncbi:MAG: hypothetical protein WCI94_02220 [Rhodospirillales bacterium]
MILEQWKAFAARIKGFVEACKLCGKNGDSGELRRLGSVGQTIIADLLWFSNTFRSDFSARATKVIQSCCDDATGSGSAAEYLKNSGTNPELTWMGMIRLSAFETEMTYLMTDYQVGIRSLTERAFTHLQRSIVADEAIRQKWRQAFCRGEIECEKLGALQLLAHGIWAFKVSGEGERTDLIFSNKIENFDEIQRSAEGLVLTEWKICRKSDNSAAKFTEACQQAKLYTKGVLAGTELESFRYVVVVSEDRIDTPSDLRIDSVTWRHINIAVNPLPPSKSARKSSGAPQTTAP